MRRHCLVLTRRLSTSHALPTRKQHFKEHLYQLRSKDPDRWSARALSRHFGLPLENVEAMLTLQVLEAERSVLDPELVELAEDAEEYLDSEFAQSVPPPAAEEPKKLVADEPAPPSVALEQMSLEQELALVGAVAARYGGGARAQPGVGSGEALGAAVHEALSSLSLEELRALDDQLRRGRAPSGTPSTGGGEDEEAQRRAAMRSMLGALCADVLAPSLLDAKAAPEAGLAALGLPGLPARRGGVARPQASGRAAGAGPGRHPSARRNRRPRGPRRAPRCPRRRRRQRGRRGASGGARAGP